MKLDFHEIPRNPRPVHEWEARLGNGTTVTIRDCGSMFLCNVRGPTTSGLGDNIMSWRATRDEALDAALKLARACGMVTE